MAGCAGAGSCDWPTAAANAHTPGPLALEELVWAAAELAAPTLLVFALALARRLVLQHSEHARRHAVWATCAVRLGYVAGGYAALPLCMVPLLEHPPADGVPGLLAVRAAGSFNVEALLLALSALLLPLPLKHHLWVQAVALRLTLARVARSAHMHSAPPTRMHQCHRFVRIARLTVQAVVPGAFVDWQELQLEGHSCWMQHMWALIMVAYALPAAVVAALEQHARAEPRQQHVEGAANSSKGGSDGLQGGPAQRQAQPSFSRSSSDNDCDSSSSVSPLVMRLLLHPTTQAAMAVACWLFLLVPLSTAVWVGLELTANWI